MTRGRQPAERDFHERFTAWLLNGAGDDPARDLALHGAVCPDCRADMAAFDLLAAIDSGRAPMPPSRPSAVSARRARTATWVTLVTAVASLVMVAAAGWALGSGRLPLASGSPSPAQQVLGGLGGGELASATPVTSASPGESAAATSDASSEATAGESAPLATPQLASDDPGSAAPPATAPPERSRTPRPTSAQTATPSPAATATPTPAPTTTPVPECSDGVDNDDDGRVDWGPDPLVNDLECLGPEDDSEELL